MNKKYSFTNKTAALLLAVSLPITVFAGCQNKNTTANAASKQAGNSSNNGSRRQNGTAPNLDQFKQRMADNIKSLVDDKTITQEQADKIVAALTENMQGFGGRQRNDQNNQGGQNNNQNTQNGSQSNGQGNAQNNGQNRQNGRSNQESSALSKLVTDKVITQAQADAVMQKIRGNFNRPQNNQNQQNNNNNNNNNNNGNQGA